MNPAFTFAKWTLWLCAIGWIATTFLMTRLPPGAYIRQDLLNQPTQIPLTQESFNFNYKNHSIQVQPVAGYTLWGLVVSHNDPGAWYAFDLSHDEASPNTRDVCLLWGDNLKQNDYRDIKFHSDDNFCLYSYGADVQHFNEDEISNNHLITDNDDIRRRIASLHIGDQVFIKGMLVNYKEPSAAWQGQMRNTSTVRTDRGNGACEIIFVQDLKVIDSYNGPWATLHNLCFWGFLTLLGLWVLGFVLIPTRILKKNIS